MSHKMARTQKPACAIMSKFLMERNQRVERGKGGRRGRNRLDMICRVPCGGDMLDVVFAYRCEG